MREYGPRLTERRRQLLPFSGSGIALYKLTCRPIAVARRRLHWQIDMDLPGTRSDVTGALYDDCSGLVIVGLLQKPTAGVNVALQIRGDHAADFTSTGYQCFWINRLRDPVPPGNRIKLA